MVRMLERSERDHLLIERRELRQLSFRVWRQSIDRRYGRGCGLRIMAVLPQRAERRFKAMMAAPELRQRVQRPAPHFFIFRLVRVEEADYQQLESPVLLRRSPEAAPMESA